MTPSLHKRLLQPLLWMWAGSAALAAMAAFWLAGRSTEVAFDRILADDAQALASQVHWDATGPVFAMDAGTAASLVYDSLAPSHFVVRTLAGHVLVGDARLQPPEDLEHERRVGVVAHPVPEDPRDPQLGINARVRHPGHADLDKLPARPGVPPLPQDERERIEREIVEGRGNMTPDGARRLLAVALEHPQVKMVVSALGSPPADVIEHVAYGYLLTVLTIVALPRVNPWWIGGACSTAWCRS